MYKRQIVIAILLCFLFVTQSQYILVSNTIEWEDVDIVYLNTYGWENPDVQRQYDGFYDQLKASGPTNYRLSLWSMNMDSQQLSEVQESQFTQFVEDIQPDVIVIADDGMLRYLIQNQLEWLTSTPAFFIGINDPQLIKEAVQEGITIGSSEDVKIEKTLSFALALTGNRQIHVVYDDSPESLANERLLRLIQSTSQTFDAFEIKWIDLTEIEYMEDTTEPLMIITPFSYRNRFSKENLSVERLLSHVSSPVFTVYETGVEQNGVGGMVSDGYLLGSYVGKQVAKWIQKTPYEELDRWTVDQGIVNMVNYEMVREFGWSRKDVNSYMDGKPIIWLNDRSEVIKSLLWKWLPIALLLGISIVLLLVAYRQRKSAKRYKQRYHCEELEKELISREMKDLYSEKEKTESENSRLLEQTKTIHNRYAMVFKASSNGLWDEDMKSGELHCKEEWYVNYIHVEKLQHIMKTWYNQMIPEDKKYYNDVRYDAFNNGMTTYECEYRIYSTVLSDIVWICENGFIMRNSKNEIQRIVGGHQDISNRKKQEERIVQLVYKDTLTGMQNKLAIHEKLSQLCVDSEGLERQHALILLDIDDFKHINDAYGHDTGDQILIMIAERLKELESPKVTIGRFGGDEFILVMEDFKTVLDIEQLLQNIQRRFIQPFNYANNRFQMKTSIGIAIYPQDGDSAAELLKSADLAMYHSKERGRDTYTFYDKSLYMRLEEKLKFSQELYNALMNGEIYLMFQPIVHASTGELYGLEALLRWKSQVYGQVSPLDIIKEAEQNGLIHQIGLWVFKEAIKMLRTINQHYHRKLIMSINLSTVQLNRTDLLNRFFELVNQMEVNPHNIVLEITETALIENFNTCIGYLTEFRKLGFQIALDDFGTGYSSLSYFKRLPIDYIKIDKSFIDEMLNHEYDMTIIEIMEMLAHNRELSIVAEGIETEEQLGKINDVGYDYAQGYLFSKPLVEEELVKYLEELS